MLKIGVVGFGGRISGMVRQMEIYDIPYRVAAVVDPRADEIRLREDAFLKDCVYYDSVDDMVAQADLDGIMIGTHCALHTDMTCKVAATKLPLFLEKPVAISFDEVKRLDAELRDYPAPIVVSFPLRVSPVLEAVKEIVDSGKIGTVEHVVAFNDVPYALVYYRSWYRNYDEMGGLYLQKATHDFDYIFHLMGRRPARVAAMNARRVYGGDKPFDLRCRDCEEFETCPESPFNHFKERFQGQKVDRQADAVCVFADGIRTEDLGNAMIEFEDGAQAVYTQNFFARNKAARRGARLYGYKGTLEFDWYRNQVQVYSHRMPKVETVEFTGNMPHFGGDRELTWDFLTAMRDGKPSRAPLAAGIESALACLWARESAENNIFCDIRML